MIGGGNTDDQGAPHILIVLEPGNVASLQVGKPIGKNLSEFVDGMKGTITIAFTPDADWVREQIKGGARLLDTLEASLTRKEVYERPYHSPERLKNVR